MADSQKQTLFRKLPSVDAVLQVESMGTLMEEFPRWYVLDCVRETLKNKRKKILSGDAGDINAAEETSAARVALEVRKECATLRGSI